MEDLRFDGRVAIVTGAGRGLGEQFALMLGRRGARVVVNDLAGAPQVAGQIVAEGGQAVASAQSVAEPATADEIVRTALDTYGRIDILINNAGVLVLEPFEKMTYENFQLTLSVHLGGSWNLSKAVWPHMCDQQFGRIVMVASANGVVIATPDHSAYGAGKGAMVGLMRELALEGAPKGIQVNALLPGATTPMLDQNPTSSKPTIPMGADLVAPGACWLVHEDCDATGRLFVCSSARIAEAFMSIASGYQGDPSEWTLEDIRDHWDTASSRDHSESPSTIAAYNAFRTRLYIDAGNTLTN